MTKNTATAANANTNADVTEQNVISITVEGVTLFATQDVDSSLWDVTFTNNAKSAVSPTFELDATELGSTIALMIGYGNPPSTDFNVEDQFANDIPSVIWNATESWRPNIGGQVQNV